MTEGGRRSTSGMKSPPSVRKARCHRPYPLPLLGRTQCAVKPPTPAVVIHVGAESLLALCCCCCWHFLSSPPTSISKSRFISPTTSSSPVRCLFSLPGPSLSASGVSVMLGCRPCLPKGEKSEEVGEGLELWSEYCGMLSIGIEGWPCAEDEGEGGDVM